MRRPNLPLVLELGAWAILQTTAPLPARCLRDIKGFSEREWQDFFRNAGHHRLHVMIWSVLVQNELQQFLPVAIAKELTSTATQAKIREAMLQATLVETTSALANAGINAICCKGIILSSDYYPARGMRCMQDIDFWIIGDQAKKHLEILEGLGFSEMKEKTVPDARNLKNRWGVLLDVHSRMKVFESRGFDLTTLSLKEKDRAYRVFRPEALVAHLVIHMLGHGAQTGILLTWVLDLLLVVRKHPDLDWSEVRRLLPDNGSWEVLLRFLKSFQQQDWYHSSKEIERDVAQATTIPWHLFARQLNRLPWSGQRGWYRLARHQLTRKLNHLGLALPYQSGLNALPVPSTVELLLSPWDWLLERSSLVRGNAAVFSERDPR